MSVFEKIQNDINIIELYDSISKFEDIDKGWAHHDLNHVKNVAKLVESLLTKLEYSESFIEDAKIAAILHDTGAIEGKENHAIRSYRFAKNYLKKNNILLKNEELVLEAIKTHSDGFDSNNIIALTLILSDKLDIKETRVAKEGYSIRGMRQLQYINDILVDIDDSNLIIKFICDNKIDKEELEEFYFMEKVFKSIISFSEKMNLQPRVLLNHEKWQTFDKLIK